MKNFYKRVDFIILTGITAEFNPLHKGHELLFSKIKNPDGIIVVLSSNFTQRGSPSISDKLTRADNAVIAGADLVLELPFLYSCSAAQDFSRGAVNILGRLGFVEQIAFGMEDVNFDAHKLVSIMINEPENYKTVLKREMSLGASFPKANSIALENILNGSGDFITKPNNLLAVSYMLNVKKQGFNIEFLPVKRTGSFKSSLIRENITENSSMLPDYSFKSLNNNTLYDEGKLWPLLQCLFIRSSVDELREIYGIDEGIEGLFLKNWKASKNLGDFIGKCVCSRYTRAHIRRRLIYILLGLKRADVKEALTGHVPYTRVLAFNRKGREILRKYKKYSQIPIISRLKDIKTEKGKYFARTENKASQLYSLIKC